MPNRHSWQWLFWSVVILSLCGVHHLRKPNYALAVVGEIINCDSIQIYKGIEMAAAKPYEKEKRGVAYHPCESTDIAKRIWAV